MNHHTATHRLRSRRARGAVVAAAALAAAGTVPTGAAAGTTPGSETISTAGSTALRNWFVVNTTTFTDVQPGSQLTVNGTTYPTGGAGSFYSSSNPNGIFADQLAPKNYPSGPSNDGTTEVDPALRFEYHESGSVEGVLEMANDQIAPVQYVTRNVDRNPTAGVGNAVWVNYNPFGGAVGRPTVTAAGNASSGATAGGYTLGNFYANQQLFAPGGTAQAAFDTAGGNTNGGQNAVQLAVSDAVPAQVFANGSATTDAHAATPWLRTPQDLNYGTGNPALAAGGLGTANASQAYQSTGNLNMPATATNPRTGAAFGTGPWNTAGLGNLTSTTVASTATLFVANPGTGLTRVDRTDAQFLQATGRLANGALFNVTTRDVNSGTRNVAALETGLDPTYAVGANDDGNGNAATGYTAQVQPGPALRFSNKVAGGGELRPTVQVNRMAVGTLSINDANGQANTGTANPLRALSYSDSADGSAPYVAASYYTIAGVNADGTPAPAAQQYTIFQNEQFVTVKAPDAAYGTSSPNVQGSANGDVRAVENNTLNSVASYVLNRSNGAVVSTASPAAGLLNQGYVIPQLMGVTKAQNGLNVAGTPAAIGPNAAYDAGNASTLAALAVSSGLVAKLSNSAAGAVTSGSPSSVYGGSSAYAAAAGFNGQVALTAYNGSAGGNYLFGNLNQTGVRDYDAVVVQGQKAQAALAASGAGVSAFAADGGSANATTVTTGVPALDAMTGQATGSAGATKGDLIALGDFNGDGRFDGRDLYLMAVGASLSDATARPTETTAGGATAFTTAHVTATAATFGAAIATAVLNKNTALDYLRANHTAQQAIDARAVLSVASATTAIPAGATAAGTDPVSGLALFTFDPAGSNAFHKTDVNQDGVVDANDAVAVDNAGGKSFAALGDSLTATIPAPVTGTPQLANLVLLKQVDDGPVIGPQDLAVANAALAGTGNANWYGYALNKAGPGTVTLRRNGGTVTVYPGASLNVSAGTFAAGGAADPFTDTSGSATANAHLAVVNSATFAVTAGSKTVASLTGGPTLAGTTAVAAGATLTTPVLQQATLSLAGALVVPAGTTGRAELVGSVAFPGDTGRLDLNNADLIVRGSTIGAVSAELAGGTAAASGIVSSTAAANARHTVALGAILNSATGSAGGAALYGSFDAVPVTNADVLVKYTYFGDANLDGVVNGSDYTRIDAGYASGGSLTGWFSGDFNDDGKVDGSDYTLIDDAFDLQAAPIVAPSVVATATAEVAAAAVPEPAAIAAVLTGGAGLAFRRARRPAGW